MAWFTVVAEDTKGSRLDDCLIEALGLGNMGMSTEGERQA